MQNREVCRRVQGEEGKEDNVQEDSSSKDIGEGEKDIVQRASGKAAAQMDTRVQ